MKLLHITVPTVIGLSLTLPGVFERFQAHGNEGPVVAESVAGALTDAPLPTASREKLEAAFDAAARMPLDPHGKTRARIQEEIVAACLELDQPLLASRGAAGIENWRRGVAYGDLALYCLDRGLEEQAMGFLKEAIAISEDPGDQTEQSWRRDRIRSRIAQAYRRLGEETTAAGFEDGNPYAGTTTDLTVAMDDATFEATLEAARTVIKAGDFEYIQAVLEGLATMHATDYAQAERRERIETLMVSSWQRIPVQVRVEMTLQVGENALVHGDRAKALEQVVTAKKVLKEAPQALETSIPLQARLIHLRFDAGQTEVALREAQAQQEVFQGAKHRIADIFRAETLRPLAETYHHIGREAEAAALFRQVIAEGIQNPNARPRLEDTVATALTLARLGVKTDDALDHAIQEAFDGLGDPW